MGIEAGVAHLVADDVGAFARIDDLPGGRVVEECQLGAIIVGIEVDPLVEADL